MCALTGDAMAEELTPGQRRADALGLLAEAALAADLDRGTAGDRYQVVLHVEQEAVASERPASRPARGPANDVPVPDIAAVEAGRFDGALEVGDGALRVSAETSQRLSCDASLVHMRHDSDGAVIDVGRKTRTVPPSIRRALAARDTGCRFPGCTSRRCDAHHVDHSTPARTPRTPGAPAGPTVAPRASTTSCCCVAVIIAPCTKADAT